MNCAISNLPLDGYRVPIRVIFLTQGPYAGRLSSPSHSTANYWFPRTPTFKTKYNEFLATYCPPSLDSKSLVKEIFDEQNENDGIPTKDKTWSEIEHDAHYNWKVLDNPSPGQVTEFLEVAEVLVREDVWQTMLTLKCDETHYDPKILSSQMEEIIFRPKFDDDRWVDLMTREMYQKLYFRPMPFLSGLEFYIESIIKKCRKEGLNFYNQEVQDLISNINEILHVEAIMQYLSKPWNIPIFTKETKERLEITRDFHKAMTKITEDSLVKYTEDYDNE